MEALSQNEKFDILPPSKLEGLQLIEEVISKPSTEQKEEYKFSKTLYNRKSKEEEVKTGVFHKITGAAKTVGQKTAGGVVIAGKAVASGTTQVGKFIFDGTKTAAISVGRGVALAGEAIKGV